MRYYYASSSVRNLGGELLKFILNYWETIIKLSLVIITIILLLNKILIIKLLVLLNYWETSRDHLIPIIRQQTVL